MWNYRINKMKICKLIFSPLILLLIMNCSGDETNEGSSPLIRIEVPNNNFSVSKGETIILKIKSNDPDGLVDKVEINVNDSIVHSTPDSFFDYAINSLNMKTGINKITAIAYDNERNTGEASIEGEVIANDPVIKTLPITYVGLFSIYGDGYEITNEGIPPVIRTGICYNTSGNPTIDDAILNESNYVSEENKYEINVLERATKYYIRSFAENGDVIVYGNEIEISTEKDFYSDMGSFIDERDRYEYKWVKIGDQTWMAENLRIQENNFRDDSLGEEIAQLYGEFYDHEGCCCPSGWRLPKETDWSILINYLGGNEIAAKYLKDNSSLLWEPSNLESNNYSMFSALPGGHLLREVSGVSLVYNSKESGKKATFIIDHLERNSSGLIDYSVISINYNSDKVSTTFGNTRDFFLDIFDGASPPVHNIRCIKD